MDFKIVSSLSLFLIFNLLDVFGFPTKPLETVLYVRHGQNITLPCTALNKTLEKEGRFRWLRWYIWAYNGVKAQWVPLAAMNEEGGTYVDGDLYKGFNISRDEGGLYINDAQPCHAQKFMCSVVPWSGGNPVPSKVILKLADENENPPKEKLKPSEAATTSRSENPEKVLVEITYPYRGAFIVAITIAAISIFGNVVLAFLLCRVRSHRSTK
ncbi:uncharacterized protein [Montipora capricornis]|uniref:uncharacterized protein isoform X2 n=1 Tax=Montipora capricornis TaxID=246305 RepID=UPI0035F11559